MIENVEQAKERLKEIVDFYKLNDENNYDYSDDVLISMKLVLEEVKRLNNIINELEKYVINEQISEYGDTLEEAKEYLEKLKRS